MIVEKLTYAMNPGRSREMSRTVPAQLLDSAWRNGPACVPEIQSATRFPPLHIPGGDYLRSEVNALDQLLTV